MLDIEHLSAVFDVTICQTRLPGARGLSHKTADGYLVVLNENLSDECIERTLDHEFLHIILHHFDEYSYKPEFLKEREVEFMMNLLYGFTYRYGSYSEIDEQQAIRTVRPYMLPGA